MWCLAHANSADKEKQGSCFTKTLVCSVSPQQHNLIILCATPSNKGKDRKPPKGQQHHKAEYCEHGKRGAGWPLHSPLRPLHRTIPRSALKKLTRLPIGLQHSVEWRRHLQLLQEPLAGPCFASTMAGPWWLALCSLPLSSTKARGLRRSAAPLRQLSFQHILCTYHPFRFKEHGAPLFHPSLSNLLFSRVKNARGQER